MERTIGFVLSWWAECGPIDLNEYKSNFLTITRHISEINWLRVIKISVLGDIQGDFGW